MMRASLDTRYGSGARACARRVSGTPLHKTWLPLRVAVPKSTSLSCLPCTNNSSLNGAAAKLFFQRCHYAEATGCEAGEHLLDLLVVVGRHASVIKRLPRIPKQNQVLWLAQRLALDHPQCAADLAPAHDTVHIHLEHHRRTQILERALARHTKGGAPE